MKAFDCALPLIQTFLWSMQLCQHKNNYSLYEYFYDTVHQWVYTTTCLPSNASTITCKSYFPRAALQVWHRHCKTFTQYRIYPRVSIDVKNEYIYWTSQLVSQFIRKPFLYVQWGSKSRCSVNTNDLRWWVIQLH